MDETAIMLGSSKGIHFTKYNLELFSFFAFGSVGFTSGKGFLEVGITKLPGIWLKTELNIPLQRELCLSFMLIIQVSMYLSSTSSCVNSYHMLQDLCPVEPEYFWQIQTTSTGF